MYPRRPGFPAPRQSSPRSSLVICCRMTSRWPAARNAAAGWPRLRLVRRPLRAAGKALGRPGRTHLGADRCATDPSAVNRAPLCPRHVMREEPPGSRRLPTLPREGVAARFTWERVIPDEGGLGEASSGQLLASRQWPAGGCAIWSSPAGWAPEEHAPTRVSALGLATGDYAGQRRQSGPRVVHHPPCRSGFSRRRGHQWRLKSRPACGPARGPLGTLEHPGFRAHLVLCEQLRPGGLLLG
jgi:hypothetical protein